MKKNNKNNKKRKFSLTERLEYHMHSKNHAFAKGYTDVVLGREINSSQFKGQEYKYKDGVNAGARALGKLFKIKF